MNLLGRVLRQVVQACGALKDRRPGADWRALARRLPPLGSLQVQVRRSRALLAPLHERYIAEYSSAQWAMSLETASLLHALCGVRRPARVLDTGSGFSSAVLRLYARDAGDCDVDSVDEDAGWLARTAEFLHENGLRGGRLALWPDARSWQGPYDLILHDMGRIELRTSSLDFVIAGLAQGGLLVLDDMHYEAYNAIAAHACAAAGLSMASARHLTLDGFGRYASLALR